MLREHCVASLTNKMLTHHDPIPYCFVAVVVVDIIRFLALSLFIPPHSQNIKMYHIKNMKCVNNKMAIRIWNAKLLCCNRHESRERESVYKAWIIKGPIEFVLWPKCKAASTLVSFFYIYGMNTSLSTFNGLWDVWSYRTLTDIKKWNVFEHHFDSRFGKKMKRKIEKERAYYENGRWNDVNSNI